MGLFMKKHLSASSGNCKKIAPPQKAPFKSTAKVFGTAKVLKKLRFLNRHYSSASLSPKAVPDISQGFIKDCWARQCEPVQQCSFVYEGKIAAVGQRTETQLSFADGNWCRLSGVVTHVSSPDLCSSYCCGIPNCNIVHDPKRDFEYRGYVKGQTMTSYAILNFDFYEREAWIPIKARRYYRVEYKVNMTKVYPWVVQSVYDVTNEVDNFPQVFEDFLDAWPAHRRLVGLEHQQATYAAPPRYLPASEDWSSSCCSCSGEDNVEGPIVGV